MHSEKQNRQHQVMEHTKLINKMKGAFKRRLQADCGGINSKMYKEIDLDNIEVTRIDGSLGNYRCTAKTFSGSEWDAVYMVDWDYKICLVCGLTYHHKPIKSLNTL